MISGCVTWAVDVGKKRSVTGQWLDQDKACPSSRVWESEKKEKMEEDREKENRSNGLTWENWEKANSDDSSGQQFQTEASLKVIAHS